MSRADPARLAEARALRDAAWTLVRNNLGALQGDLAAHGIGERIKHSATKEAQQAWGQARAIAAENKGVVAGTVLALVGWFLRGQIGAALSAAFASEDEEPPAAASGEETQGETA